MTGHITILNSGLHLTVQDMGRKGMQALGVPESGSLDHDARIIGNALVGNASDTAVLETCFGGLSFSSDRLIRVALTGTIETTLSIQDAAGTSLTVPAYRSIDVAPGRTVSLGPLRDSFAATIAISGGIDTPLLYNSRATSPNATIGGYDGRLLQPGDHVPLAVPPASLGPEQMIDTKNLKRSSGSHQVRVVLGPQDNRFTSDAMNTFLSQQYRMSPVSNRMGIRLEGPELNHIDNADIPSDGIVTGAIQVPGNGQPIILLADHQTTGGYTKIATVISADLPRLAHVMPGQYISFTAIDIAAAEAAARDHHIKRQALINSMYDAPSLLDLGALYTLGDTT